MRSAGAGGAEGDRSQQRIYPALSVSLR